MSMRAARRAARRGAFDEALVHLWNELEPARLSGDRGRLEAVAAVASDVAERGDAAQAREAERLLEELEEAVDDAAAETFAPLEPVSETVIRPHGPPQEPASPYGGTEAEADVEGAPEEGEPDEGEPESRRSRLMSLLWAAIVIGVFLVNVLLDRG